MTTGIQWFAELRSNDKFDLIGIAWGDRECDKDRIALSKMSCKIMDMADETEVMLIKSDWNSTERALTQDEKKALRNLIKQPTDVYGELSDLRKYLWSIGNH
jgi:hypothetical protein